MKDEQTCREIGRAFHIAGDFVTASRYGSGHINETYAATYEQAGQPVRYVLQKVNHRIFRDVPALMENVRRVTAHLNDKLAQDGVADRSRRTLTTVLTRDGQPFLRTDAGEFWRVYFFVEGARTYDRIENTAQAFRGGASFRPLSGAAGRPARQAAGRDHPGLSPYAPPVREPPAGGRRRRPWAGGLGADGDRFLPRREGDASALLDLHAAGRLPLRVTHNDCKLNNVMLDDKTGAGLCVIDLDTVMPGLALYDFGDMVRTATSPVAEDERDVSKVKLQLPMFEALTRGYLAGAGKALVQDEIAHLASAVRSSPWKSGCAS